MNEMPYARVLRVGEPIDLFVGIHDGVAAFEPEFIFIDGMVSDAVKTKEVRKLEEFKGEDEYSYDYFLRETYDPDPGRFRSVRIFKVSQGEKVVLRGGEWWHGRIDGWRISDRKSKDGRTIIYVTICGLQRRYSWDKERDGDNLVIVLRCGDGALRKRVISLKERLYRFREKGDPAKIIFEIKALGTEQRPIALTDVYFPRRTTLDALINAEIMVFAQRLRTHALRKVAAQNILKTIKEVNSERLKVYLKVPFVSMRQ